VSGSRGAPEGDDVGFIRIAQFSEQTTEDLKKAITDLSTQAGDKLKCFIVDLARRSRRIAFTSRLDQRSPPSPSGRNTRRTSFAMS
jgi:hypothetical protein